MNPRRDECSGWGGVAYTQGVAVHDIPAVFRMLPGPDRRRAARAILDAWHAADPQPGGTVVFMIRADGREVFRSPRLAPGRTADYDVDLAGVSALELATEDGGDGINADWGLWLAPGLVR